MYNISFFSVLKFSFTKSCDHFNSCKNIHINKQKYAHSRHKYLSFNVMKYYIELERLTRLNKNANTKITLFFFFILIDFYIKLYTRLFLMLENKTIISEINKIKFLFIELVCVKTNMQIIHTIYYVNHYFLVIYHTDCRILNVLIT